MAASIEPVIQAFLEGKSKTISNTSTDGSSLFLFENRIAWIDRERDVLTVTNANWRSKTTKDRINMLPNVWVRQHRREWYIRIGNHYKDINDGWKIWDGKPIEIDLRD